MEEEVGQGGGMKRKIDENKWSVTNSALFHY